MGEVMSEQPKWQRARFIPTDLKDRWGIVGRFIWVRAERPKPRANKPATFLSNLTHPAADREEGTLCVNARCLELLPDFKDDVPLMAWEQWLAQPVTAV